MFSKCMNNCKKILIFTFLLTVKLRDLFEELYVNFKFCNWGKQKISQLIFKNDTFN